MKGSAQPIVSVTAYDAPTASLADQAGVDFILVGDSVGTTVMGMKSTLTVSLEAMIHHTAAASRGIERALIVGDLPFGSYQSSVAQAVDSAVALVKAGAEAVKLEGSYTEAIQAIVNAGIPCMGHVGFTPQSINKFGGHRVQGRGDGSEAVLAAAKAVEDAGAFAVVLELIPADLAREITCSISIPTIGIGAGPHCDGQVQVLHDILGLTPLKLKHAKIYLDGNEAIRRAIQTYADEVRSGAFPASEHSA
jgi:3-methyl-2-oxobutanoate hydroxymethyltransferase